MKTQYLPLFIFLFIAQFSMAQATVGKVEYQKSQQPAAIMELPFTPEVVDGAIRDHMAKKGSKPNTSKGFTGYKNVQLSLADPSPSDVYFKIDRKSRKENNISVVYMVVGRRDENIATRSSEDFNGMEEAKAFLNDITPAITSYSLEQEIKGQDEELKKAQKKLDNLADEGRDLDKRKRNLEERISENLQSQERQRQEIEKQRAMQDNLMKRRM